MNTNPTTIETMTADLLIKKHTIEECVAVYNGAITGVDTEGVVNPASVKSALTALQAAVKNYNDAKINLTFAQWLETEYPMLTACQQWGYPLAKAVEERDEDGDTIGMIVTYDNDTPMDLKKFAKECKIDTTWLKKLRELSKEMLLDVTHEMHDCDKEVHRALRNALGLEVSEAKHKPLSATQIATKLQGVADCLLTGDCKVTIKNRDAKFLERVHTGMGKKRATLETMKENKLVIALVNILHVAVGIGAYSVSGGVLTKEQGEDFRRALHLIEAKKNEEIIAEAIEATAKK